MAIHPQGRIYRSTDGAQTVANVRQTVSKGVVRNHWTKPIAGPADEAKARAMMLADAWAKSWGYPAINWQCA